MSYLVHHHGAYWFQIRVPRRLTSRYGKLIRQNLNTTDRILAQSFAFQLAGQWLARFSAERLAGEVPAIPPMLPSCQEETPKLHALVPQEPSFKMETGATLEGGQKESRVSSGQASQMNTMDDLMRYWRQLHPESSPSTNREMTSVVKDFKRTVKRLPQEITRQDMMRYRDTLLGKRLARATVRKKIGFIRTLLQNAVEAGALDNNVARGIRVPKPKVAMVNRRAHTADELKKIFTSPVYRDQRRNRGGGEEAAAWIPLLGLATGARLEEICQLKISDIILDSTHGPLMKVTDEGEGQRVKTTSSRRTIPLHPEVIKAGFLRYREGIEDEGQEWLFPALEPDHDDKRSGNWSKWYSRYLRSPKGCHITDRCVVFHSFRHTFKTICREAGISEEIHDALTGHASATVGRSYGYVPLSTLVKAVEGIRFPVSLPGIME